MINKLISVVAVSALLFTASAQNARVDAMGGCDINDDISRTLTFPAEVNDYGDQLQGTASGTNFGTVIGIKGVGNMINLGFTANHGPVLRNGFYSAAETLLEQGILDTNDRLPSAFPVYPHILFGLDLDAVSLGLDMYYKATRYKYSDEDGGDLVSQEAKISHFGLNLNANLDVGDMSISPIFGLGFPKAKGINEDKANDFKTEVTSLTGLRLKVGTELGFDLGRIDVIGGFFFTLESFQFSYDDNTTETKGNENKESFMDIYLGLTTNVLNGLFLVSQYNITINIDKEIQVNNNDWETKYNRYTHDFRIGLERPISGVWIFDEVIPRGGLQYQMNHGTYKSSNSDGDTLVTSNGPNTTSQFNVTTGIGLTKGIAAVDVAISIGAWDGVLTGPSVIEGTLTLDFGKRSSGSESGSSYQTTPSPVTTEPSTTETDTSPESSGSDVDFDF